MNFRINKSIIIEVFGWSGTILVLIAYALNVGGFVSAIDPIYATMNILAALGLGVNAWYKTAYPLMALEVIWGLIGVYGLYNYFI